MTFEEELVEYLTYILEISDEQSLNIVGVFNDYSAKLRWSNCFSYGENNELDLSSNTVTQLVGTNGWGSPPSR